MEEAAAGTEPGWETAMASGGALEETATEAASGSEVVSAEALAQELAATVPAWAGSESPLEAKWTVHTGRRSQSSCLLVPARTVREGG